MSPSIIISKRELEKYNSRMGIYFRPNERQLKSVHKTVRLAVTDIVEKSFRDWAKKHKGWTQKHEDLSWMKFNEILQKNL